MTEEEIRGLHVPADGTSYSLQVFMCLMLQEIAAQIAFQNEINHPAAVAADYEEFYYKISLVAYSEKIQTIKAIREITSMGLKEAKDFVESVVKDNSQVIKQNVSKIEALKIKERFEIVGALTQITKEE